MRVARWMIFLLVAPLAAPTHAPELVTGRAYALTDAPRPPQVPNPDAPPDASEDDGIRDARSWIVPDPPAPSPPEREWSAGVWTPIWDPGPLARTREEADKSQGRGDDARSPPKTDGPGTGPALPAPPTAPVPPPPMDPTGSAPVEGPPDPTARCLLCLQARLPILETSLLQAKRA